MCDSCTFVLLMCTDQPIFRVRHGDGASVLDIVDDSRDKVAETKWQR